MIYADNAATTKLSPAAYHTMTELLEDVWGNPSSLYGHGQRAKEVLEKAREDVAAVIGAQPEEIYFTSGGSEADNQAIRSAAVLGKKKGKMHIISSAFEHHAVLHTLKALEAEGFEVTLLDVHENGIVVPSEVEAALRENTCLVTIMTANNEIGTVQPIREIGALCRARGVTFHTDAVQAVGHLPIDVKAQNIDLLSASAHKFHGPKGVGFLYADDRVKLRPLILGGGQQKGMRSGTENVPGIAGMALAAEMCHDNQEDMIARLYELKNYLAGALQDRISDIRINGPRDDRGAPHILSVSIRGLRAETILNMLSSKGIYVSAGSACTSNNPHVSGTLKAIGLDKDLLESTIRISMSFETTKEELDYLIDTLAEQVDTMRKFYRH